MQSTIDKKFSKGFLKNTNIDHDSEQFKYIVFLHERLWKMVRHFYPGASGSLAEYIDKVHYKFYNCERTKEVEEEEINSNDKN